MSIQGEILSKYFRELDDFNAMSIVMRRQDLVVRAIIGKRNLEVEGSVPLFFTIPTIESSENFPTVYWSILNLTWSHLGSVNSISKLHIVTEQMGEIPFKHKNQILSLPRYIDHTLRKLPSTEDELVLLADRRVAHLITANNPTQEVNDKIGMYTVQLPAGNVRLLVPPLASC
ncbi:TPA: hypothetical protein DIV55_07285 [Patescibacteria group bacterium]|uniref:Uncharacterized protein n=1 Tax=Candidatus Gottesmanbacteria bacterium GW2011_GWA1_43_11 TaxID=1618436 RepID=A0A0G1FD36_9BACT|nr:MAG: hypothetical protein UV59_C0014G0016 [Candidatus Gottesmanbacteria bacterium GW2011_GWA1_43_11]HCS79505.1 hypothetical protein [Patescibacteria group bacterium]